VPLIWIIGSRCEPRNRRRADIVAAGEFGKVAPSARRRYTNPLYFWANSRLGKFAQARSLSHATASRVVGKAQPSATAGSPSVAWKPPSQIHSIEEYVRTGGFHHTNTVENYFSILKRGITGVYHHVSQQHLKRYLCEFDFRYNERSVLGVNDDQRLAKAAVGINGKHLTYRRTRGQSEAEETGSP
jgi:hypothetical protein